MLPLFEDLETAGVVFCLNMLLGLVCPAMWVILDLVGLIVVFECSRLVLSYWSMYDYGALNFSLN